MGLAEKINGHVYSLVLADENGTGQQNVELEVSCLSEAMQFAQRNLPERLIQIHEDGEFIGGMKCTPWGYWISLPKIAGAN